ncbi:hypothetical protein AVEN_192748-1 [Araneus ventricosus]|uniref:Uncharacterized protein n=1 Tax=Araneus ventricosus TaxID=182803 RepID=A0A4Y2ET28_ARAVE|nr:hypothetical protein AVEN_192748-1 [Araneus ventricosus]
MESVLLTRQRHPGSYFLLLQLQPALVFYDLPCLVSIVPCVMPGYFVVQGCVKTQLRCKSEEDVVLLSSRCLGTLSSIFCLEVGSHFQVDAHGSVKKM